jgi:hypothetical protein
VRGHGQARLAVCLVPETVHGLFEVINQRSISM